MVKTASDSFSRPANTTAYAAGDLVANSATAGSVTPLSWNVGEGKIVGVRISKSGTGVTGADIDLHLYDATPTVANGDNGAWSSNKAADYLGYVDMGTMVAHTDGAVKRTGLAPADQIYGSGVVYGLLEIQGTYTPASGETFTVVLEIE